MLLREVMDVMDVLDSRYVTGQKVVDLFKEYDVKASTETIKGHKGSTDFVKIIIEGTSGKSKQGNAQTLGVVGRLGGIGARDSRIGLVSDADGAIAAIALALKLAKMKKNGDDLVGDVIVSTHICPNAPTVPHKPVDFMGSPVDMMTMNQYEIDEAMDAIISIDTTKGNKIINYKGIALSPTVKEGYILRVSDDLVRIMEYATGKPAFTFPITMQDITPYGNDIYHINSILQPAIATSAPVVGLAITTESAVPGCGSGASHEVDIASAANYAIEVAKEFGRGDLTFYDKEEFDKIVHRYGKMTVLQTFGNETK